MYFCSLPKDFKTLMPLIDSSISAVCSPLVSDCLLKLLNDFFAISHAHISERGVNKTTRAVILASIKIINIIVPTIVKTPVKN